MSKPIYVGTEIYHDAADLRDMIDGYKYELNRAKAEGNKSWEKRSKNNLDRFEGALRTFLAVNA